MTNLIGLWVNLSRAYEVALAGGFSIQVVFDRDYVEGFADYEQIKSFFTGVPFVAKGDIVVEITKPTNYEVGHKCTTLGDIEDRMRAISKCKPTKFASESCEALLRVATSKLNFSFEDRQKVIGIASVIGQLHGSSEIKVEHLAEAIHYRSAHDVLLNAEEATINFGAGISIALHDLDVYDVQNAIVYLQQLQHEKK